MPRNHSVLSAMRFVWKHPESDDVTEQHKNCRVFLKKDPKGFIDQLEKMTVARKEERAGQMANGEVAQDAGSEKCIERARERLKELAEHAQREAREMGTLCEKCAKPI